MKDNPSQEIYAKLSKFYEREIAGCSCGGRGMRCDTCSSDLIRGCRPNGCEIGGICPTCAPLRERLKGLCSIKCNGHPMKTRCSCKYEKDGCYVPLKDSDGEPHMGGTDLVTLRNTPRSAPYPDLTTHLTGSKPTVRVLLEEAGLWKGFIRYIENQTEFEFTFMHNVRFEKAYHKADILTDLTLLCQAVDSFLQEVA